MEPRIERAETDHVILRASEKVGDIYRSAARNPKRQYVGKHGRVRLGGQRVGAQSVVKYLPSQMPSQVPKGPATEKRCQLLSVLLVLTHHWTIWWNGEVNLKGSCLILMIPPIYIADVNSGFMSISYGHIEPPTSTVRR